MTIASHTRTLERPLRLAFFVHYFPQVSEAFIINQAAALIARGHQVDIFSIWGFKPYSPEQFPVIERAGLMRRSFHPDFEHKLLPRFFKGLRLAVNRFDGRRKILLKTLDPRRHFRWSLNLRLLYEAAMLDGHGPYDAIHCQFADLAPIVLRLRSTGALPAPIIVHIRGIDITRRPREMGHEVYRRIFEGGDLFLANCAYFQDKAIALGCPASKIGIYRSAIDLDDFRYRGPRSAPEASLRLALVGRLTEKKGISYAIEAVAEILRRNIRVSLTILGDGPLRQPLTNLSEKLGLTQVVHFLGARGQDDVRALLESSDVILAPSVSAQDGDEDAPVNSLKEGMAIGLPVVATRHGGIPEMVQDGISGCLVPERDGMAIADAVEWLAARRSQWADFGRAGRAIVDADYNLDRQTARLVSIYRKVSQQYHQADPDGSRPIAGHLP